MLPEMGQGHSCWREQPPLQLRKRSWEVHPASPRLLPARVGAIYYSLRGLPPRTEQDREGQRVDLEEQMETFLVC